MKKTHWWRIASLFLGCIIFGWGYLASNEMLFQYNSYVDPAMFFSLAVMVMSMFLFLVYDKVFIKWLRFALVWFFLTLLFVLAAPEYAGGWMSFGPTKESVSIWMSSLFVIISLVQIIWESRNSSK